MKNYRFGKKRKSVPEQTMHKSQRIGKKRLKMVLVLHNDTNPQSAPMKIIAYKALGKIYRTQTTKKKIIRYNIHISSVAIILHRRKTYWHK